MWFRFRFTVFGREIWSFEIDREDGFEVFEPEEDEEEEEEEDEEEEDEYYEWGQALRWGEPCSFERTL